MRFLKSIALLGLGSLAMAVEPGDLRLTFEWFDPEYDVTFNGVEGSNDFDYSYGLRLALVQPLGVMLTGDLISVIDLGIHDSVIDNDGGGANDFKYQGGTLRYGFGYRADLGDSFVIDLYPYVGIGLVSFEAGNESDPDMLFEGGLRADFTFSFDPWQMTAGLGYNYRYSDHTTPSGDFEIVDASPSFNVGGGYRF